jgi:hypothetical protein
VRRTYLGWAAVASTGLAVLAVSESARAQSTRLEPEYVERGLVAPDKTLRIDAGPHWPMSTFPTGQFVVTHVDFGDDDETFIHLNPGLSFGITEDFELGFMLPMQVAPDGDLHDPLFHLTWRFVDESVEVGLFGSASVPIEGDFTPVFGLPIFVHASPLRIDTGFFVVTHFEDPEGIDGIVPLLFPIQATSSFFVGPETALIFPRFDDVVVPLGAVFGWTITTGGGTLGDLDLRFRLPNVEDGFDVFQVSFGVDFYFDL